MPHVMHDSLQLMAMPYDSLLKGAPPPPCNSERLAAMADVNIMDAPPDPLWCTPTSILILRLSCIRVHAHEYMHLVYVLGSVAA